MTHPNPLFTQTEVALALNIPLTTFWRAVRRGLVRPDFQTNQLNLFRPSTVKKLSQKKNLR
jgi:hypothetical protein